VAQDEGLVFDNIHMLWGALSCLRILHHKAQVIPIGEIIVDGIGIDHGGEEEYWAECDGEKLPLREAVN